MLKAKNPTPLQRMNSLNSEKRDRLIRLKEVLEIIPVSKSTFWNWVASGRAPASIRLGRCTCWRLSDIEKMMGNQDAESLV